LLGLQGISTQVEIEQRRLDGSPGDVPGVAIPRRAIFSSQVQASISRREYRCRCRCRYQESADARRDRAIKARTEDEPPRTSHAQSHASDSGRSSGGQVHWPASHPGTGPREVVRSGKRAALNRHRGHIGQGHSPCGRVTAAR
jgi:hypothetical protein